MAAIYLGQSFSGGPGQEFLLQQAAMQLRGSVLAMSAAADIDIPDQPPPDVSASEAQILGGDLHGYQHLAEVVDDLRLRSMEAINERNKRATDLENSAKRLESWERRTGATQVSLSILGLIVVLLKDLPIWKGTRKEL